MVYQPTKTVPDTRINPTSDYLQASGNVSGTTYGTWLTHTQVIGGTWIRKWVYSQQPSVGGGGSVSACPELAGSYVEITFNQSVNEIFETASYAPSSNAIVHTLEYTSDSDTGGWGTSGSFWTTQQGLIRNIKAITDVEDVCSGQSVAISNQLPGVYDNTLDTSANFNSDFFLGVVTAAMAQCPNFNPLLVSI